MSKIHIMIDLETWGTALGYGIRSIGACVFVPQAGVELDWEGMNSLNTFYQNIDNPLLCEDNKCRHLSGECFKYPLRRDPNTIAWWEEQEEAASSVFVDKVDLRETLEQFSKWFKSQHDNVEDICIWSHGATTDISWLAYVYLLLDMEVPWHYRAPRDTRTWFDAMSVEDSGELLKNNPGPLNIPHHALDDAICQARAICASSL